MELYNKESLNSFINFCDKATESVLVSKKDIEYKLDQWKSGSSNLLLITGMSGGGKSTLAKELGKKYHAVVIEVDLFEHNRFLYTFNRKDKNGDYHITKYKEGEWIIKEYFDKIYSGEKNFDSYSDEDYYKELEKFIRFIIKLSKSHPGRKYIMEGLQFTKLSGEIGKEIDDYPCIVKGTSLFTSMIRRINRDKDSGDVMLKNPWKLFQWYWKQNKNVESFSKKKFGN